MTCPDLEQIKFNIKLLNRLLYDTARSYTVTLIPPLHAWGAKWRDGVWFVQEIMGRTHSRYDALTLRWKKDDEGRKWQEKTL